ncbi:MAG: hypothetical protein JXA16_09885 [Bacteroidales bacterium]|nr:hypothetical protein [Bacteroidales bacterium]
MKFLYRFIFILIIFIYTQIVNAQRFEFTADTSYVRELGEFISKSNRNGLLKAYNNFSSQWNTDSINSSEKKNVVIVSNRLLKKRAVVYPYFYDFMYMINSVLKAENKSIKLSEILNVFNQYTEDLNFSNKNIDELFKSITLLLDSGSFYQSKALKWQHNSNNYKILISARNKISYSFNKTDLICYSKRDSMIIKNTSGQYYPEQDEWQGKNGFVSWERTNFSADSVFAQLSDYHINMKLAEYIADSVSFINKYYFNGKMLGKIEDKLIANSRGEKAIYPKFYSYEKLIELPKVLPNIDYIGGFNMFGNKFIGSGDENIDAKLLIFKNDKIFAKATSNLFTFEKKRISSNDTKITIDLLGDSLYHPGLNFNYIIDEKKVSLIRAVGGLSESLFFDTYHKLDIDVKEISFSLNDTLILLKAPPATTHRRASFESNNYFSFDNYDKIGLMDKIHPLKAISNLTRKSVERIFTPSQLGRYIEKSESASITLLIRLSNFGFVNYNIKTKEANAKQKLFDYIESNYGKKDYDAISIISEPPKGNNATLDLKTMEMTVLGVKPFVLSENRRVGVVPEGNQIIIKKDLEIDFNGKLQAGLAKLYGKDLTFFYDSFYVSLKDIDSLTLSYKSEEKTKDSVYVYSPVMSKVEEITGLLRIDDPSNKSGIKTIPLYPILESHDTSYVYYDSRNEQDTVYNRNSFYFKNYAFEMDSLNTIIKKNVDIRGMFISGGIFPDFEENLTVQNDSSLGFIHNLSDKTIQLYEGKGTYDNTITLSNKGLKGSGKVDYLTALVFSEEFIFFPDSMNAITNKFELKKNKGDSSITEYPEVYIDSAYVHWEPQRDRMFINSLEDTFSMFKTYAKFTGELELKPQYLKGKGDIDIVDANLQSDSYTFFADNFTVDTADFKLKPREFEEISPVLTYNVSGDIDFIKKTGAFKSNGDSSYINFQINQYLCYMNYFNWYMSVKQIEIGAIADIITDTIVANVDVNDSILNNKIIETSYITSFADSVYTDVDLTQSSRFVSTHPKQDSLSFISKSSSYDIKTSIIKARNVKIIKIGDAHIFPKNTVTIEPKAKIRTLEQSRIVANTISRFHEFYDAKIDIYGAKAYSASADYQYFDRNDSMQIISFDTIYINKKSDQTLAFGRITQKDDFKLSPEFSYFGNISIEAKRKDIEFEGFAKINTECTHRLENFWFEFKSVINKDSIVIPIDSVVLDNENRKLYTSMFYSLDSLGIYTSFLNRKKRFTDKPILKSSGFLYFNDKTGYFEITDSAKLKNPEIAGDYMSFHKKLCLQIGEGKMDFGLNYGQVKLTPVGKIYQNLENYKTNLKVMMGVDFYFSEQALTFMAEKFNETQFSEPIDTEDLVYKSNFTELVGLKRSEQYANDAALLGKFSELPKEMLHSIFFTDVKFKWNKTRRAYVSEGQIGIGNINNQQINKLVDGKIEILNKKDGNVVTIYLEIDQFNWFFFTYKNETMKSVSSYEDFNLIIANVKDKDRKSPLKNTDAEYIYFKGNKDTRENFLTDIKNQKEEEDFNYDINITNNTNISNEETEVKEEGTITEELETEEIKELETEEIIEEVKEEIKPNEKEIIEEKVEPEEEIIEIEEIIEEEEEAEEEGGG